MSEVVCSHSSPLARPGNLVPVQVRNTLRYEQQDDAQSVDWQLSPDNAAQGGVFGSGNDRCHRHQRQRDQQSLHWQEALPELVFRRTCVLASADSKSSTECNLSLLTGSLQHGVL